MNLDKDYVKLNQEFDKNSWIVDENFLTEEYCETVINYLSVMTPTWWYHSSITADGKKDIRYLETEHENIEKRKKEALKLFTKNQFSYSFDRTIGNHYPNCYCKLCKFDTNIIQSTQLKEYVEKISGFSNLKLGTFFYTRYKAGDFLYPHTDAPNGKVALVLHLTKLTVAIA